MANNIAKETSGRSACRNPQWTARGTLGGEKDPSQGEGQVLLARIDIRY